MNESLPLRIVQLVTDDEIADVFALVAQLRPRVAGGTVEAFIAQFHRQQQDGYAAVVGYVDARPVAFVGYRAAHTLARGPHLFVDDLVTDESVRGRGYGRAILRWLAERALELGLPRVHLDSRDTARGFYANAGFEFSTSIPCSISAERLIRD